MRTIDVSKPCPYSGRAKRVPLAPCALERAASWAARRTGPVNANKGGVGRTR